MQQGQRGYILTGHIEISIVEKHEIFQAFFMERRPPVSNFE
jgi:hypothetical protein